MIFFTILRLDESFKTMNRPGSAQPAQAVTLFERLFLGKHKR